MDPISIQAGVVGIVAQLSDVDQKIRSLDLFSHPGPEADDLADALIVMDVHTRIFAETDKVSKQLPYRDGELSVKLIQLCHKRLSQIALIADEGQVLARHDGKAYVHRLRQAVDRYGVSVGMFKDIEMGQRVSNLIESTRNQSDIIQKFSEDMMGLLDSMSSAPDDVRNADIRELKNMVKNLGTAKGHTYGGVVVEAGHTGHVLFGDQLHEHHQHNNITQKHFHINQMLAVNQGSSARDMYASTMPLNRITDANDFRFTATIMKALEGQDEHIAVRGTMDTGCEENWIAMEILERADLSDQIQVLEEAKTYTAFGGDEFEPEGIVDLTWFAENGAKSRRTKFLVHTDPPFDMILGRIFIAEENVFVFDRAALAVRHELTEEQRRQIEQTAREKGAANAQLSQLRRADEKARREALRQKKLLQRTSLAASMSNTNTNSNSVSNDPSLRLTTSSFTSTTQTSQQMSEQFRILQTAAAGSGMNNSTTGTSTPLSGAQGGGGGGSVIQGRARQLHARVSDESLDIRNRISEID